MNLKEALLFKKGLMAPYLFVIVIFGISAIILQLGLFVPSAFSPLVLSKTNIFGSVTSIFLDQNWNMFWIELGGFIVNLAFFVLLGLLLDYNEKKRRALFFSIVSFIVGVIAGVTWLFLPHAAIYSYGQSLVGFAGLGIVVGFALTNLYLIRYQLKKLKSIYDCVLIAMSPAVIIVVVYDILFASTKFFVVQNGVNFLGHEIAFLIGLVTWLVFYHITPKPFTAIEIKK